MVRATRTTQLALEDPPVPLETDLSTTTSSPTSKKPGAGRKRKRTGIEDDHEHGTSSADGQSNDVSMTSSTQPGQECDNDAKTTIDVIPAKRLKTEADKDETITKLSDRSTLPSKRHQDAGDATLSSSDAKNLLAVLESLDAADLLDRHFSLSEIQDPSASTVKVATSLREMLSEPTAYTLRILSNAIRALSPRNVPSRPNLSQGQLEEATLREVAHSLLMEIASRHGGAIDSTRTNLDADIDDGNKTLVDESPPMKKFALHQRLPTGDYFTSAASMTTQQATALVKGHASLVQVQPAPTIEVSLLPKLGSYCRPPKATVVLPNRLPTSRKMAVGSFLDYGPYSSFAPSFDSEAGELGHSDLSDYIWGKTQSRTRRRKLEKSALDDDHDAVMDLTSDSIEVSADNNSSSTVAGAPSATTGAESSKASTAELVIDPALEMEDELRAAMGQLQLETGVTDLLSKNAAAMQRLVQLQNARYRLGSKAPSVEEGSEEWKLAHTILSTLTTLTSLRPRIAGSKSSTLIPPPSILRALHRTLPTDPIPGWKGTMARDKDIAYRDNSTIITGTTPYVNPTPAPATAPAKPAATTYVAPPTPQPQAATSMAQYSYTSQAYNAQRPGMVGTPQASYYPHPYYTQPQSPVAYQQQVSKPGTPAQVPGQQYFYNPYPGGYPYYGQTMSTYSQHLGTASPTPSTPVAQSRAIPNMAKPGSYQAAMPGWGTPASALPAHLRMPGTTPGVGAAYAGAPVFPPTAGWIPQPGSPGYAAAWPPQKA